MRRAGGFGLIEQIVTLTMLAILAAVAVPSFNGMLARQALSVTQADYLHALSHARHLGVNEQMPMLFCPSADGRTCHADGGWPGGWLIGRDPFNRGQPDGRPLYRGGHSSSRVNIVSNSKQGIRFQADGTAGNSNQTITLCLRNDAAHALSVVIARRGRVRGAVADPAEAARCANAG